jgi:hypothetical protein
MFKKTQAALAANSAITLVLLWINKPGNAKTAVMPNQPEPGKSTPADSNGDAQPIMQIGGTADSATAMAAVHGLRDSSRVQQKNQGTERSAAAAIHIKTALVSLDGQYALATPITGNEAAA